MNNQAAEAAQPESRGQKAQADDQAAQMQMDYDMSGQGQQVLYDMDGNEILEDEYGNEMDDVMDPEDYGQEQAGSEGGDEPTYEEFEALIEM